MLGQDAVLDGAGEQGAQSFLAIGVGLDGQVGIDVPALLPQQVAEDEVGHVARHGHADGLAPQRLQTLLGRADGADDVLHAPHLYGQQPHIDALAEQVRGDVGGDRGQVGLPVEEQRLEHVDAGPIVLRDLPDEGVEVAVGAEGCHGRSVGEGRGRVDVQCVEELGARGVGGGPSALRRAGGQDRRGQQVESGQGEKRAALDHAVLSRRVLMGRGRGWS